MKAESRERGNQPGREAQAPVGPGERSCSAHDRPLGLKWRVVKEPVPVAGFRGGVPIGLPPRLRFASRPDFARRFREPGASGAFAPDSRRGSRRGNYADPRLLRPGKQIPNVSRTESRRSGGLSLCQEGGLRRNRWPAWMLRVSGHPAARLLCRHFSEPAAVQYSPSRLGSWPRVADVRAH